MDSFAESPGSWEGAKKTLSKKDSEQRAGTRSKYRGVVRQELLLQS